MKIVAVNWRDLANPLAGGAEVVVDRLLTGLQSRGHEVALVCGGPVSERPYRVVAAGGTYSQYLKAPWVVRREFGDADVLIDAENGIPFFSPLWWRKPTVCLVHHLHTDQWADRFPVPVACIARSVETKAMPFLYRKILFVAVSNSTAANLEDVGVAHDQIRVIESGVDRMEDTSVSRSPTPLFLVLGRLVPHKRTEVVLDAWMRIQQAVGGRLVVAGDGPELSHIRDRARHIPNVDVVGRVTDAEKASLLGQAWLLVTATHHEGWGMTVLEAASAGIPTLAFDVPGIRDAVRDQETGVLIHCKDSELSSQLAHYWKGLALDNEVLVAMGKAAQQRADSQTWEVSIDRWERTLEEALHSG